MPKRKLKLKQRKPLLQKGRKPKPPSGQQPTEEELRVFVADAQQVEQMANSQGWRILRQDLERYAYEISTRLAYLDPNSKEFNEARVTYLACDKLTKMVEDYAFNRRQAEELLVKLATPQQNVALDVDTE